MATGLRQVTNRNWGKGTPYPIPRLAISAVGLPENGGDSTVIFRLSVAQDLVVAEEGLAVGGGGPDWSLYCLCDGHGGDVAAGYVKCNLWTVLEALLPEEDDSGRQGLEQFALEVREAVIKAFVRIGYQFKVEHPNDTSGASVTMALHCGRLLTIANVGDAHAAVDTGRDVLLGTVSDRIESNPAERRRLEDAGALLAQRSARYAGPALPGESGDGPIRCWPGGVMVSRSVGDVPCGEGVLSWPHVCQMALPKAGARVVMGSSGLWGLLHWEEAAMEARGVPVRHAASNVIHATMQRTGSSIRTDTSALVFDAVPPARRPPPRCVGPGELKRRLGAKDRSVLCGLHRMMCTGKGDVQDDLDHNGVHILAKVDGWVFLQSATEAAQKGRVSNLAELTQGILDGNTKQVGPEGHLLPSITWGEQDPPSAKLRALIQRHPSQGGASAHGSAKSIEDGIGDVGFGMCTRSHCAPLPNRGLSVQTKSATESGMEVRMDSSASFHDARIRRWIEASRRFATHMSDPTGWRPLSDCPDQSEEDTRWDVPNDVPPSQTARCLGRRVEFVMSPAQESTDADDSAFQGVPFREASNAGGEQLSDCMPAGRQPCRSALCSQKWGRLSVQPSCAAQRVAFTMAPSEAGSQTERQSPGAPPQTICRMDARRVFGNFRRHHWF